MMKVSLKDLSIDFLYNPLISFEQKALKVFHFQYENNPIYQAYCKQLNRKPEEIKHSSQIPCLPIGFFKSHVVSSVQGKAELIFESSGTTGSINSKHYVWSADWYKAIANKSFYHAFITGVHEYCILALLPGYLERGNSSLVYMVNHFVELTNFPKSGFYLNEYEKLYETILEVQALQKPIALFGVTYALLDFGEWLKGRKIGNLHLIETGGMKGTRPEMIKSDLHETLKKRFGAYEISSEYGMTELMSQAYSGNAGQFEAPPTMKLYVRDVSDPFQYLPNGRVGGLNIIDLGNVHSCAFIETQDLAKINTNQTFELMGRLDHADIRGCNLMIA